MCEHTVKTRSTNTVQHTTLARAHCPFRLLTPDKVYNQRCIVLAHSKSQHYHLGSTQMWVQEEGQLQIHLGSIRRPHKNLVLISNMLMTQELVRYADISQALKDMLTRTHTDTQTHKHSHACTVSPSQSWNQKLQRESLSTMWNTLTYSLSLSLSHTHTHTHTHWHVHTSHIQPCPPSPHYQHHPNRERGLASQFYGICTKCQV